MNPTIVPVDLRSFDYRPLVKTIQVSDAKKAEVREATREALSRFGL